MEIRTVYKLEKRSETANSEDGEEEEETLSLSDLAVHLNEDGKQEEHENQEDFEFELSGGVTLSSTSEMCSADDIFFKGQILPFRSSSVSSENSNPKSRCLSRTESIETFSSSRSSSSSAHSRVSKPRIQNQFLTHSSPKPQIRIPNAAASASASSRNRKSTVWEFFRLGLVHTPEIELQDLKARNSVSRNSSSSSSNSNNNSKISSRKQSDTNMEKQRKQSILEKRLLLTGCNCTVNSVSAIKIKNEKNEEMEIMKKKKKNHKKKMVDRSGKGGMSSHRTFEWIKELSNSSFLEQEEGHT